MWCAEVAHPQARQGLAPSTLTVCVLLQISLQLLIAIALYVHSVDKQGFLLEALIVATARVSLYSLLTSKIARTPSMDEKSRTAKAAARIVEVGRYTWKGWCDPPPLFTAIKIN